MNDELEQLYDRALNLPRDARASFVAQVPISDERLRAELLSLVSVTEGAEKFFFRLGDAVWSEPVVGEALEQSDVLHEGAEVGRYTIVERIGYGGMGTVYRAREIALDRWVALKILDAPGARDPAALERFAKEARAAARTSHPGIVKVHAVGESEGRPWMAMELVDGDSLASLVAPGGLRPRRAFEIARDVARALQAAHEAGVIHRDFKPANVFLDEGVEGKVTAIVCDFGVAKALRHDPKESDITATGAVIGTPLYMAPEQLMDSKRVDERCDVWALGHDALRRCPVLRRAPHGDA
jgi:serine/threonine protein kinase